MREQSAAFRGTQTPQVKIPNPLLKGNSESTERRWSSNSSGTAHEMSDCEHSAVLGVCCCSVAQSCLTLCDPMDCSTPGFPVHHQLPELAQTHVHQVSDATNHLTLCHPFLLLPSIFPGFRVFFNESALHIRWPKYWSFGISPSNKFSGMISFRIDCFDLLAVQRTLKSLFQHHTYMQSTSCEMPDWMTHQLESILPGEISTTSEMQMIAL